jgi:hypothetical protein
VFLHCPRCGFRQSTTHTYCIACGERLPTELLEMPSAKETRWYLGYPVAGMDESPADLRVSRYDHEIDLITDEGSVKIPAHHVRFSIWRHDSAVATVSISEDDAASLSSFLIGSAPGAGGSSREGHGGRRRHRMAASALDR